MIRNRGLAVVAAAMCVLLSATVFGQESLPARIPDDILKSTTSLTSGQETLVKNYVAGLVAAMAQAPDAEVINLRSRLVEPLRMGAREVFTQVYPPVLLAALPKAALSDRVIVRTAVGILLTELAELNIGAEGLKMMRDGLNDKSPAVRYWAAKAVDTLGRARNAAGEQVLASQARSDLLASLYDTLVKEDSPVVLSRLLIAMVGLETAEARLKLLEGLNNRIPTHEADPTLTILPEIEGLQALYRWCVRVRPKSDPHPEVPDTLVVGIAKVAYRYTSLASQILDRKLAPGVVSKDMEAAVTPGEEMLLWALGAVAPETKPPAEIKNLVIQRQWSQIVLILTEFWRKGILAKPPFGLDDSKLVVNVKG